jgi:hypothetical protein
MPNAASAPSPRQRSPLSWIWLGLPLLSGLALRLWLMTQNAGITMDSPLYWRMAQALRHGQPALGPAHHGYPALIALASTFVHGAIAPGRTVSLLAAAALMLVVYALARRTLEPAWASLAVWLVALHPLLGVYGGVVMTESTVLALSYGALLLMEQQRFLAGGVTMGLAYLVRPEALVLAPLGALCARGKARKFLLVFAGIAIVMAPYVGYLRWERGSWMISPKTVLVRPTLAKNQSAEWRVGPGGAPPPEEHLSFVQRLRWAAPSVARNYGPGLLEHLRLLLQSWPWPLMLLSALGWAAWRRALLAPLLMEAGLPLLAVPFDPRFSLLAVPALAVFAACGASWLAELLVARPRVRLAAAAAALVLAGLGLWWVWQGQDGRTARNFDDGPMHEMRLAGEWLATQGPPGARVMDRKAYVPFFAGMEHVQLPNDDYDTIIEFAQREGVRYLVLEEYVVRGLRKQMQPLANDPEFRAREKRLRLVYAHTSGPDEGVAVLEVLRDSTGADSLAHAGGKPPGP